MALTRELIVANAVLAGLSDEQIQAIETLSQNDENSVMANRIGQIYGDLDRDILTSSGMPKNGTEKTYDYAKRVVGELKAKAEGIKDYEKRLNEIDKEKKRLEKVIEENGADAETKKALTQAQKDLEAIKKQYNELNTKYGELEKNHATELFGLKIEGEINSAISGLKFKQDFPESATKVLLAQAIEKVKSMNPEYIDDGRGGKMLVFKDETGAIVRNPNNQLNPFSAGELLSRELETMGILDTGRNIGGAGGKQTLMDQKGKITLSGVRTQTEAYEVIAQNLMAQGFANGTQKFDDAMAEAWKDNNISQLPEQ